MANILTGKIDLSKIPAEAIRTDNYGNKSIWVDVVERQAPSNYGDTHYVSIYDKERGQRIYLGNLRPRDFGSSQASVPPPAASPIPPKAMNNAKAEYSVEDPDLPF